METIACPACGAENSILRDTCINDKCGADLIVVKNVLSNANKHYNSGLEMSRQGRYDEAVVELNAAIELYSKNPSFHNLLGTIYARKGLYDLAIKAWEETLMLDPTFEKAYRSIDKARKVELHLHRQYRERPYKIAAAWVAIVAVAAILAALFLGLRYKMTLAQLKTAQSSLPSQDVQMELDSLKNQLTERQRSVGQLQGALEQAQEREKQHLKETTALQTKVEMLEARPPSAGPDPRVPVLEERVAELDREAKTARERLQNSQSELQKLAADVERKDKQLADARTEAAQSKQRLQKAGERAEILFSREQIVAQAFELWQQQRYKDLQFVLEQMELLEINPALVADLRGRADHEIALQEDPLYRAEQKLMASQADDEEKEKRAYYAGLKIEEAQQQQDEGQLQSARDLLGEALAIDSGNKEAEEKLLQIQAEIDEQEKELQQRLQVAQAALASGDYEEAIEGFEALQSDRPNDPNAAAGLKTARDAKQKAESAEAERQRQIAALSTQAQQAEEAGNVEQALESYRQWLSLEPDNRSIQRTINRIERREESRKSEMEAKLADGRAWAQRQDYDRALDALTEALLLARLPKERDTVQAEIAAVQQTREQVRQIQLDREKTIETLLAEAEELIQDEIYDTALETLEKVLQLEPGNRKALSLRRSAETAQSRQQRDQVDALEQEAERLEQDGDPSGALERYRQILQLDPEHRRALKKIEQLAAEQE